MPDAKKKKDKTKYNCKNFSGTVVQPCTDTSVLVCFNSRLHPATEIITEKVCILPVLSGGHVTLHKSCLHRRLSAAFNCVKKYFYQFSRVSVK